MTNANQKEVQSNSVTYKRKDYLNLLADAENALASLAEKRQKQMDEWKADTAARKADFNRLIEEKFVYNHRYDYNDYLSDIKKPVEWAWLYRLMGRPVPERKDQYGSFEAYAHGEHSLDEFVDEFWSRRSAPKGSSDGIISAIALLAREGWTYTRNDWKTELEAVQEAIRGVEVSVHEGTFTIPRETFDKYAAALVRYETGTIEPLQEVTLCWRMRR